MIQLVATEGELTVVRRLAGYCYGEWTVEWPDSVPEDQRPVLDDDRAHGYVHRLGEGSGRMGRRFVRADVSITAAEYDQAGVVPHTGYTDVEEVLDAAVSQTDEDALVERAITRDGLGPWRPGTDFRVGDLVDVVVWGRSIVLPVTAVEAVTEAGAVVDWRVTVGGQLVADDVERRRSNAELERAVWQERRERVADVGRVSAVAGRAQFTADTARGEAQHLRDTLSGAGASEEVVASQLEELNAQLQARGEGAADGLIPAYIAANTARWRLQEELDAAQDEMLAQALYSNFRNATLIRTINAERTMNQAHRNWLDIFAPRTAFMGKWSGMSRWEVTNNFWDFVASLTVNRVELKGAWSGTVRVSMNMNTGLTDSYTLKVERGVFVHSGSARFSTEVGAGQSVRDAYVSVEPETKANGGVVGPVAVPVPRMLLRSEWEALGRPSEPVYQEAL